MTDAPAPEAAPAPGAAPAPSTEGGPEAQSPAQTATNELSALMGDADFVSDFDGSNGRQAQIQARDRKTELTRQAHGVTEETATPLPPQIQAGLDHPDLTVQAAAEAMRPGETADDFSFVWSDASTLDLDDLQNMNTVAAEAAFSIGANPQYARSTVAFIDKQLAANAGGPELTPAALDEALTNKFGSDGQAIAQSAADLIDRMPDSGRQWLTSALRGLDAQSAAVVVERLGRVAAANAPKA